MRWDLAWFIAGAMVGIVVLALGLDAIVRDFDPTPYVSLAGIVLGGIVADRLLRSRNGDGT